MYKLNYSAVMTAPVQVVSVTSHPNLDSALIPERSGDITVSEAIDRYMASYEGRDPTRPSQMLWWQAEIGQLKLNMVDQDHIFFAIEKLSKKSPRYFAGKDADGNPIFKAKSKSYAPATLNRYVASIGALFTWCIRKRLVPKKWEHPCRGLERKEENNEIVRFLSDQERVSILKACRDSKWEKLYLLALMALTTGARKSEILRLKWSDINFERQEASVQLTKNGDRKILPIVPAVLAELEKFKENLNGLIFVSSRCPNQAFSYSHRWKQALKAAKVKDFRFHDFRHTCASLLAQNNATLLEIGDVLGQRQVNVTKRYSHLTVSHKAKLLNRVLGHIS